MAAPRLSPLTSSTMDLIKIGLVSDKLDPRQLRAFADWTVRPRLLATRGVAGATVYGSAGSRFEVRLRPAELAARQVSLAEVSNAIAALTAVRGGGFTETANQRILVRPTNGMIDASTLGSALIPAGSGGSIALRDLADVTLAAGPQFGDALVMGRPGVLVSLSSQYGANTLEATRAVEATLADMKPVFAAQGIRVYPALHRPANFIETALHGMSIDLLIGAAMIGLVLFAFLRNLRVALIAFVSIPLSLLAALIVLYAMDQTINTMTLGGLTVALGVVVDDAVVGVENIVRRLRGASPAGRRGIISDATVEVRAPVVYATYLLALTIAPILFLTGLQGAFFAPLALSFLLAVLASLAVAVTITPALALLLLGKTEPHPEPTFLFRAKDNRCSRDCPPDNRTILSRKSSVDRIRCLAGLDRFVDATPAKPSPESSGIEEGQRQACESYQYASGKPGGLPAVHRKGAVQYPVGQRPVCRIVGGKDPAASRFEHYKAAARPDSPLPGTPEAHLIDRGFGARQADRSQTHREAH
nr:efflux RND transporter permease subunit [Novosphingobium sp. G106]